MNTSMKRVFFLSLSSVPTHCMPIKTYQNPVHTVHIHLFMEKIVYFSIIHGKYLAPSLGSTIKHFVNFIFFILQFYERANDTNGRQCATEYQAPDRERCKGGKKEENVHGYA